MEPAPAAASERALRRALDDVAAVLRPPCAPDAPPGWLRPDQRCSFGRVLGALRHHRIACLADPVGAGKTFIALAAAATLHPRSSTVCLVPAILARQWTVAAMRLGIELTVHTHERLSRGKPPPLQSPLVVIDESHRFRNPATRRYRTAAPWLVGSDVLLLTATPIVNRPADLLAQLRLGAPDDVLAPFGVPSLVALLVPGAGHPALARLVVQRRDGSPGQPRRTAFRLAAPPDRRITDLVRAMDALRLSEAPDVAALVRVGLLRALASSPAALAEALARYRSLLLHATDAANGGGTVTRHDIRRAVGADDAQIVLWSLLGTAPKAADVELDPGDLPRLAQLLERLRSARRPARGETTSDAKAERLRTLLGDGRPTIVFASYRATIRYLRDRLDEQAVAWCTGSSAGIGRMKAPRELVLGVFDPARRPVRSPRVAALLVTDVAAEGLNLQSAGRVVHYDLPWSPTRLRQREGRAVRLGSSHATVEVIRFGVHAAVEKRLGLERLLRRKARWAALLDFAGAPSARGRPTPTPRRTAPARLVRAVDTCTEHPPPGRSARGATEALVVEARGEARRARWLRPDRSVTDDIVAIAERIVHLRRCARPATVAGSVPGLSRAFESDGRFPIAGAPARAGATAPAPAPLLRALTAAAAAAARARDGRRLEQSDLALAFLRRSRTAGEEMLLDQAVGSTDPVAALHRLVVRARRPGELRAPGPGEGGWVLSLLIEVEPA